MPVFEYSKILPCPPDEAWAAVADFPSRRLHSKRYRRADLPDGREPEPGHRIDLQIGPGPLHQPGHRGTKGRNAVPPDLGARGFWVGFSYYVRECSDGDEAYTSDDRGHAYVTFRAEYGGWLGSLIAKLRPGACKRYVLDEMDAVSSATESIQAEPVAA